MTYQRAPWSSLSSDGVKARSVCVDSRFGRRALGASARRGGEAAPFESPGAAGLTGGAAALAGPKIGALTEGATGAEARLTGSTESERTGMETVGGSGWGRTMVCVRGAADKVETTAGAVTTTGAVTIAGADTTGCAGMAAGAGA